MEAPLLDERSGKFSLTRRMGIRWSRQDEGRTCAHRMPPFPNKPVAIFTATTLRHLL